MDLRLETYLWYFCTLGTLRVFEIFFFCIFRWITTTNYYWSLWQKLFFDVSNSNYFLSHGPHFHDSEEHQALGTRMNYWWDSNSSLLKNIILLYAVNWYFWIKTILPLGPGDDTKLHLMVRLQILEIWRVWSIPSLQLLPETQGQVWIQSFPSPRLVASPRLKNLVCPTIYP